MLAKAEGQDESL